METKAIWIKMDPTRSSERGEGVLIELRSCSGVGAKAALWKTGETLLLAGARGLAGGKGGGILP
jgi:hypothetical protein